MPERREEIPLLHMLDHATEALVLTQGRTRADLDSDRLLELALVRLLEIVGEAASRVPRRVRAMYSDIPWPQIVALRNRLIHGYYDLDLDIIWSTVSDDIPPLVRVLEDVIRTEE